MDIMKMEEIINDIILIVLKEVGDLSSAGINHRKFYAKVLGYDDFGIWIEHPDYEVVISEDEKGKPLPPNRVTREKISASVLIQWSRIATLVHFPNRENFDFPSPFTKHIGFDPQKPEEDNS